MPEITSILMLRYETEAHPALHHVGGYHFEDPPDPDIHFAPNGWEDLDRGICPCGEVVVYRDGQWVPDRDMVVLILNREEAKNVAEANFEPSDNVVRQLIIQEAAPR